MKILYLTPFDMRDTLAQSGTVVNIERALKDAGNDVITIDNLKVNKFYALLFKFITKITRKQTDVMRTNLVLKSFQKQINKRKKNLKYDVIFSSTSMLCSKLIDDKPIVFYTDATFGGMLDYYWNSEEWNKRSIRQGMRVEEIALENCTKAIFASNWAINTAIEYHNADYNKCVAINRGANIYHPFTKEEILERINKRTICKGLEQKYQMLFVGRDWDRKGGPLAIQIVKELNRRGYPSKLVVVGCQPQLHVEDESFVEIIGFLKKDNPDENIKLQELYLTSDFYLQPSLQEAQGIAYAESSAFGLPVVAVDTGGVSDIVNKKNGILFNKNDQVSRYTEEIILYIQDSRRYKDLSISTYEFYQEKLNWSSIGKRITKVLEELV